MSAIEDLDRYARARHRHMGRGELFEADVGLSRRIVAALREHGAEEADLDELVYEAAGAQSSQAANEVGVPLEQQRLISKGERRASEINNSGMAVQVDFLIRAWGSEAVLREIRALLRPSSPKPC
jgi:hypothetical protein